MEKKEALLNYLNDTYKDDLQIEDIKEEEYDENRFQTPYGTFEVLTDEEADEAHLQDLECLIDDVGLDAFSPSFDISPYLNLNNLDNYMREDYETYCNDIESETGSGEYENRLQEEIVEFLEKTGDYDEETFFEEYEDKKEEFVERYVDYIISQYDSSLEWLQFNFGDDSVKDFIQHGLVTIDTEALSKAIIKSDGRGNSLSSWDGCEIEQDGFFLYKQDEWCIERESESPKDIEEPELA